MNASWRTFFLYRAMWRGMCPDGWRWSCCRRRSGRTCIRWLTKAYLKGRYHWNKMTEEGVRKSSAYL